MDPETNRLLGELRAGIASLQRHTDEEARRAADSRARVYQRLDAIQTETQDTRQRLGAVETVIDREIRPVVRGVLDWRSRWTGAVFVLGLIGSGLLLLVTVAKDLALDLWRLMSR